MRDLCIKRLFISYCLKREFTLKNSSSLIFLLFIRSVSFWLPDKGTLDEAAWESIGKDIKTWILEHKDEKDEGQVQRKRLCSGLG